MATAILRDSRLSVHYAQRHQVKRKQIIFCYALCPYVRVAKLAVAIGFRPLEFQPPVPLTKAIIPSQGLRRDPPLIKDCLDPLRQQLNQYLILALASSDVK